MAVIGSADKRRAMADGIRAVVQAPTTGDIVAASVSSTTWRDERGSRP